MPWPKSFKAQTGWSQFSSPAATNEISSANWLDVSTSRLRLKPVLVQLSLISIIMLIFLICLCNVHFHRHMVLDYSASISCRITNDRMARRSILATSRHELLNRVVGKVPQESRVLHMFRILIRQPSNDLPFHH